MKKGAPEPLFTQNDLESAVGEGGEHEHRYECAHTQDSSKGKPDR